MIDHVPSHDMVTDSIPGLDLHLFHRWLTNRHPELLTGQRLTARRITGGLSNLTYLINGGIRPLVLRRPPLGHVLHTAHDMGREYRVMTALRDSTVPVPATELLFDDTEGDAGVGAPFYLMDFAPGRSLTSTADNKDYTPDGLHQLSLELGATLANLHDLDWRMFGLADFGRPDGFLERQFARWTRQLEQSRSRELPELDHLAEELGRSIPKTTQLSLIHGDFRLDNTLVTKNTEDTPHISAVLDWEMSTIGDSLTDLGLFGLYWDLHSLEGAAETPLATSIDPSAGYASFTEIVDHYSGIRGLDAPLDLSWYLAFASFKLAVILEGIHYRYGEGKTVGEGFDRIGQLVSPLARRGHDHLSPTA